MEYHLRNPQEAQRFFESAQAELDAAEGRPALVGGHVKVDSIASERGAVHNNDGSLVIVWYTAANQATARAIREASIATDMGLPRKLYVGKLIDIKKGNDGTVYFKLQTITRREERRGIAAFRAFNPSKGQVLRAVINPEPDTITNAQTGRAPGRTEVTE